MAACGFAEVEGWERLLRLKTKGRLDPARTSAGASRTSCRNDLLQS
jgi:hypothetical protein